jgi:putative transposase
LQFIKEETQRFEIEILSWRLVTNHVHFVVVPHDESSLAKGFGDAHKRYARMNNFSEGVCGYLFQGRFGSYVLDEHHLLAAVRYVENNPVAAGIVKNAPEYPWSSAAYHVGNIEDDALVKVRSLYWLVNDWRIYLSEEKEDEFNTIRKATRTGRQ